MAVSTAAPRTEAAQRRAIARVVREVSEYLGNTPAVARSSYIDPRVIELYEDGITIASELGALASESQVGELATRGRIENAVRRMLAVPADPPAPPRQRAARHRVPAPV